MATHDTIGAVLRRHRLQRGLSLAGMAELLARVGVVRSRAMVHHYETQHTRQVPRDVLSGYVDVLELDTEDARAVYETAGYVVYLGAS